ncbi:MAG: flagellar basal body P-ring formation chaperone FlgA [Planctomycetota bacterium]
MVRRAARTIAIVGLVGVASAAFGGELRLRAVTSHAIDEPITVAEIAELSGGAESLGGVVLVSAGELTDPADRFLRVTIDEVRAALRDAGHATGRLAMSGGVCTVRLMPPETVEDLVERAVREPVLVVDDGPADVVDVSVSTPPSVPTIRGAIAEMLERELGVGREAMRLGFDNELTSWLDAPTWGRRLAVSLRGRPGGGRSTARALVAVRVYAEGALVDDRTISVTLSVQRAVCELTRDVRRGEVIGASDVRLVDRWIAPGGDDPASDVALVVGFEARRAMDAGEAIKVSDVEAAIAVERNQLVTVLALSGGIEVQTRARSLESASVGEIVECRIDRDRRSFMAEVIGPGRVILRAHTTTERSSEEHR